MQSQRALWMRGNFGMMSHWLYHPVDTHRKPGGNVEIPLETAVKEWNHRVNGFDVERLADQLEQAGAKWFILTIGQNSGFYCAPNPVYDQIVGYPLSKCSQRDLFRDLAVALKKKGIRTLAYLPSGAPEGDFQACLHFKWQNGYCYDANGVRMVTPDGVRVRRPNHRLAEFQQMWEQVVRYWAQQWGELCAGWWIDGVYFADQMYQFTQAPNFHSFAAALRAGNPQCAICFNGGIQRSDTVDPLSEEEDYTAGEMNSYLYTPFGHHRIREDMLQGRAGQAQLHLLNFLGKNWGQGDAPRFPEPLATAWTDYILHGGGAVTWDVPTNEKGEIPQPFIQLLQKIGKKG